MGIIFMLLALIGVTSGQNIARGKTAYHIETDTFKGVRAVAEFAVDGKPSTCSATTRRQYPWFFIDFGKEETVSKFILHGAGDCPGGCSLGFFQVFVGSTTVPNRNPTCISGQLQQGEKKEFSCTNPMKGRYFYIRLARTDRLIICEVEVFSPGAQGTGNRGGATANPIPEKQKYDTYDNDKAKCTVVAFHEDYTTWCTGKSNEVYIQKNGKWELVDGFMRYISVGQAGVFGVAPDGKVHYRQGVSVEKPEGLAWTPLEGQPMLHVTSGPSGKVWGIDQNGQVVHRDEITCDNPMGNSWKVVPGTDGAFWISCNSKGCWEIKSDGTLRFRIDDARNNPDGNKVITFNYDKNQGRFVAIDSSFSGKRAIAISDRQEMFEWDGQYNPNAKWTQRGKDKYLHAVPAHMGYIATTQEQRLRYFVQAPGCNFTFNRLDRIDAGKRNSVCGISEGKIYQKQGKNWILMDGTMERVSCSERQMWGVNNYNDIFYRTSTNCSNPFGSGWKQIKGKLVHVDVGHFGQVYGVDSNDRVLKRQGITESLPMGDRWASVPGRLSWISCCDYGCWGFDYRKSIYMRPTSTPIFRYAGDIEATTIEAGEDGLVFVVDKLKQIYMRTGVSRMNPMGTSWFKLYENMHGVAYNRQHLYVIDNEKRAFVCRFPEY